MGSEELADNIFRIAQTDAKLKRDNVDNEYTANSVHFEVGKEIRNSIKKQRNRQENFFSICVVLLIIICLAPYLLIFQ